MAKASKATKKTNVATPESVQNAETITSTAAPVVIEVKTPLETLKKSTIQAMHKNSEYSPYPIKKTGRMALQQSQIPKDSREYAYFYIDKESLLQFSIEALKRNITTDELMRRLVWAITS